MAEQPDTKYRLEYRLVPLDWAYTLGSVMVIQQITSTEQPARWTFPCDRAAKKLNHSFESMRADYDEVVMPSHFAHGRDGLTMINLGRHQKMRTGSCLGHIVHDLVSMTLPLCGPD
jgi:hypothetical protein